MAILSSVGFSFLYFTSIFPVNPLYQGFISNVFLPVSLLINHCITSSVLQFGTNVEFPVPIPTAPFINTNGIMGKNVLGSTVSPSSTTKSNIGKSSVLNT